MIETLIIGGTGSLGEKLLERFLKNSDLSSCDDIAIMSRDENKQWLLKNNIVKSTKYFHVNFYVGDVRDKQRVNDVIRETKPRNVIIAAALKQIDTCEVSPFESVQTNILGVQNVIDCVKNYNDINRVIFISTDKAAQPTSVYGMCKAISERLITSQNKKLSTQFICTRYGNVLESRGSIVPLLKWQAQNCDEFTVTNPDMTRFFMTLDDSVDLVEKAKEFGFSGETWLPKIQSMRIGDLAEIFSNHYNKPIKIIGSRQGEKLHEDLITTTEISRCELRHNCYVLKSSLKGNFSHFKESENHLSSISSNQNVLTRDELETKLNNLGIFK